MILAQSWVGDFATWEKSNRDKGNKYEKTLKFKNIIKFKKLYM